MASSGIKVFTNLYGFKETHEWLAEKMSYSDVSYVIGTNVEYAIYVEFGTSKMAAQPYLFEAAEMVFKEVESMWEEAGEDIGVLITRIAMRIERLAKILCPVDTGNLKGSIEAVRL